MNSYLTFDKGKSETVLFKMGLCLWICRDSKILKSVILLDVPIIVKSRICTLELQERLWSLILFWHGWEIGMFVLGVTAAWMVRDPNVKSATCRSNVARRAPVGTVFIMNKYCSDRISEHNGGRLCNETRNICFVYCLRLF